jgi:hypothetical protein
MKCSQPCLWATVLLSAIVVVQPAFASNNPLAGAMGNLRWGMRNRDVKSALKSELNDKSKLAGLEASYVEFDGTPSQWDKTPLSEEYTHGNDEAMMTVEGDDGARNYYFFIGGELWKWVKLYPAAAFGGRDFQRFSTAMERRFGKKGHSKSGEINPGSGKSYKFVEYMDRNTRVRAVDKLKDHGRYALVFESLGTVRSLAALRSNSPRRADGRADETSDTEESNREKSIAKRAAARDEVASPVNASASSAKSRSIFSEQPDDEAGKEETARKPRPQANARKSAQRSDERPRPDRETRNLDRLLGADDDDPLLGLPQ